MPKKTRSQKKQADVRRSTMRLDTPVHKTTGSNHPVPAGKVMHTLVDQTAKLDGHIAIRHDLQKTFAIAAILFTLEIAIFYAKLMGISFNLP